MSEGLIYFLSCRKSISQTGWLIVCYSRLSNLPESWKAGHLLHHLHCCWIAPGLLFSSQGCGRNLFSSRLSCICLPWNIRQIGDKWNRSHTSQFILSKLTCFKIWLLLSLVKIHMMWQIFTKITKSSIRQWLKLGLCISDCNIVSLPKYFIF